MTLLRRWVLVVLILALSARADEPSAVKGLAVRAGDGVVLVNWDAFEREGIRGWRVSRADQPEGMFRDLTSEVLSRGGFADTAVTNGVRYAYRVQAVQADGRVGPAGSEVSVAPVPFADDAAFLEFLQAAAFDFFWREANPTNGLVRDRNTLTSPCSIAAVGFGLSAIAVGIDHGWVTRAEGCARVASALRTLWTGVQGSEAEGTMGYRGWFYHFIDLRTGHRYWRCELSSIDTALLLAGVLDAREYFDREEASEEEVRRLANALVGRADWNWMANGKPSLAMGWKPGDGFLGSRWIGYNEAMILYVLGMGAGDRPLPAGHWRSWTEGYEWRTHHGFSYVEFAPLFGHQYSHAWIDFRGIQDDWMRGKGIDYFENSRRATLAQRAYCAENPGKFLGYGANLWGITACDGPRGYSARGAPPADQDDGTLAPTAVGGSMAFAPEACLPALREMHRRFRRELWTAYGFRDAFNLTQGWWGPDVIGIDQGILLLMIENHRTGRVWDRMRRAREIQRGLAAAGFRKIL